MYNWADICSELKVLEKRVGDKMGHLISGNPDPFPFDRLQAGREIATLSRALRMFIEVENEKDATVILTMLTKKGVKLKSVR